MRTRFTGLGRGPAIAILFALLLLIGIGLSLHDSPAAHPRTAVAGHADADLYRAIDARMLAGEDYYHAAAGEHRARGYPLRPFVTVRTPTLAWLTTLAGGPERVAWIELMLAVLAITATLLRLRQAIGSPVLWAAASLLLVLNGAMLSGPAVAPWHELWAGLLIALALAIWNERRWPFSVLLGLAAVLFRELAMPFLVAMAACALIERRPREALGWVAALLLAIIALTAHAAAVHAVLLPGDPASQGWSRFGGWRFDMAVARGSSLLILLPMPFTAVLLPLMLLGWMGWASRYAARFALTLAGWLGPFLLIGRPENFYWGLLMAPLLPIGLAAALPALRDLFRAARSGPRLVVQ